MKPWQTKEWRERRKTFLEGKTCEWCRASENLVIHHPSYIREDGSSISEEEYINFEASGAVVLCRRCHLNLHKGRVLCRACKRHYHLPRYDKCFRCALEEKPHLVEYERLEYVHPWCGRKFLIERQWWEIEASPQMCCIEHCKPNSCEIASRRWS